MTRFTYFLFFLPGGPCGSPFEGSDSAVVDSLFVVTIVCCLCFVRVRLLCNSYTMGCPPVRLDNSRALASGLSYVQVDKHGITILYHLQQCRPCTS